MIHRGYFTTLRARLAKMLARATPAVRWVCDPRELDQQPEENRIVIGASRFFVISGSKSRGADSVSERNNP